MGAGWSQFVNLCTKKTRFSPHFSGVSAPLSLLWNFTDMADSKPEQNTNESERYDASKIEKLEGLEGVRKRPDMYIGDTGERGLHHCVFELLDNAIDEHMAVDKAGHPYCNNVKVAIHLDGSCSVEDDGRGIPVDMHAKYKMPAIELVLTNLHAGGKFGKGAYQVSG